MSKIFSTKSLVSGLACAAVLTCASSLYAVEEKLNLNIQGQHIGPALMELGEKAGVQIMLPQGVGESIKQIDVQGEYTLTSALNQILSGSGLKYEFLSENSIAIKQDPAQAGDVDQKPGKGENPSAFIEEMVVTAQKRAQSLQDAAMSISAFSGETIEKRGFVGMEDYLQALPGVSMQDRGVGQNSIVVRGIASDPQLEDAAVGVYFGETPIMGLGTADSGGGAGNADIKMVDIDRIEVLRGPQGTLYGSGSMGGTVRVIPKAPNLEQMEGKLAMRYSQTGGYGGDNNMMQGVFNLPIVQDKLAVRAVVYQFENSGFIKNIAGTNNTSGSLSAANSAAVAQGGTARDWDDVGSDQYTGFRVTALWQATEQLGITLAHTYQKIEQDGAPEVYLNLGGDFEQEVLGTGVQGPSNEFRGNKIDITNLVVDYDFGWANLTGSTSWINYESDVQADVSFVLFAPFYQRNVSDSDVFVGELRLASQLEGPWQFVAGVYYQDFDTVIRSDIPWSGSAALDPGAAFFTTDRLENTDQRALFGELSYDISEQVTATFGARHFEYDRGDHLINTFFGAPLRNEKTDTTETGQTYKLNLTYTPSEDLLFYGQWTEGFRVGKGVVRPTSLCDLDNDGLIDEIGLPVPDKLESDTLDSFELGVKTALMDNRVTVNASLYRINWDGIPVSVSLACHGVLLLNAGESKSEGVELEVQAYLTENLKMDFGASYGEATLTEDAPNLGNDGDNLPGSADYNVSIGLEYGFTIAGFDAFARGDYAYVSEYYHNIAEIGQPSGGYSQINLKTGVTHNGVTVDLFVNNLTDADDFTWVEAGWGTVGNRAYRLRPRTIGINVGYRF